VVIFIFHILFLEGFAFDSLSSYITLAAGCFIGWAVAMFIKKIKKK